MLGLATVPRIFAHVVDLHLRAINRLLEDKEGLFYSMCEKTGDLPRLIALARASAADGATVGNGHGNGAVDRQ